MRKKSFNLMCSYTNILFTLFLLLILFSVIKVNVLANSVDDPLGFTVEPIMPKTQIDENKTYFFIKTNPGESQKIKIKITGNSIEPVNIKIYLSNAITSEEVTINYLNGRAKDDTLKDSLEDISSIEPSELTVNYGETKEVTITINSPNETYSGVKLGAIYFAKESSEDNQSTIKSQVAYRIGLVTSSDGKTSYSEGKFLNLLDAVPELLRSRKTIGLTIQNPESQVIRDLSMKIEIINKENHKTVKMQSFSGGSIAPNSRFTYSLDWGLDPIPNGTYIAKIHANSDLNEWVLEKKFTISTEKAKKMNDETTFKLSLPNWAYFTTIILFIATSILVAYLIQRDKKLEKIFKILEGK